MASLGAALAAALEAATRAGGLLLEELHRAGGPRGEGDHAEIDEEVERLLRERLLRWGGAFLGEETGRSGPADSDDLWVVDPNDGTSSFLKGHRGSVVSIALLRAGQPVLGVVHAFAFPDDDGDLIAWASGGPLLRRGRPLPVDLGGLALERESVVLVSHDADRALGANARCVQPGRFLAMPSIAYRLARVAAGEAVAAVSLNGPHSWDFAGGHALLLGAGGVLVDEKGLPVTYGPDGQSRVRHVFGGAPQVVAALASRPWGEVFQRPAPGREEREPPEGLRPCGPARGRAVRDPGRLARAQGCLLGQLAGEPAAHSELALMLARSLVAAGGYDASRTLQAYVHCYRSGPFDLGGTTGAALGAASAAATPAEALERVRASASQTSRANGSLMRVSPLGIAGAADPVAATGWARQDSALTHPSPTCADSCAVYVAAIAHAVATGATPAEIHALALGAARESRNAEVAGALERARGERPDFMTHQGFVLVALQNAFYQLLHAPTLEEGVVDTVMSGGDTDTNAAIAGALLGAAHGREAVPARWQRAVLSCRALKEHGARHPRPPELWGVDALVLAERLLRLEG